MRLAAIQSSYVPWKGYFHVIARADRFLIYDDVAYSKNGWRNRNRIRVPEGVRWLTIPVRTTGRFGQRIDEVEVSDPRWAEKHWKSLESFYARAPGFGEVGPWLRGLYERAAGLLRLTEINEVFLRAIVGRLDVRTPIGRSSEFDLPDDAVERLIRLCELTGSDRYLSGPSARAYLDLDRFRSRGIEVEWMDYSGYAPYSQVAGGAFVHEVSVLDLLLNLGFEGGRSHFAELLARPDEPEPPI